MASTSPKAVFIFPAASGHTNPTLPLARALVSLGWTVEYLHTKIFKEAIEDTGAVFVDRDDAFKEQGIENVTETVKATLLEYNESGAMSWALNFGSIATQRLLPIYISWLQSRKPQLVVYCPVLCSVAHFACLHLHIPDVSLLTAAGPGFFDAAIASTPGAPSAEGLVAAVRANEANSKAVEAIRAELGMPDITLNTASDRPLIFDYYTAINIVTTTVDLADPVSPRDVEFYRTAGKKFEYVGPLLDLAGSKRCAGHLSGSSPHEGAESSRDVDEASLLSLVEAAVSKGRQVVYVSMGTVLTGDDEKYGWNATSGSALTSRQLCQAVYRAVFEQLGDSKAPEPPDIEGCASTPLVVVSLGPQPDALESIEVPRNVVYAKSVPQVDLLRNSRPVLFVTNGGQNSLMESMAVGTPVVVCPGFGDQVTNAAKVEAQGWGVKVDRPKAETEATTSGVDAQATISSYQATVESAVRQVLDGDFTGRATAIAAGLERAGGVSEAVRILIEAAGAP